MMISWERRPRTRTVTTPAAVATTPRRERSARGAHRKNEPPSIGRSTALRIGQGLRSEGPRLIARQISAKEYPIMAMAQTYVVVCRDSLLVAAHNTPGVLDRDEQIPPGKL